MNTRARKIDIRFSFACQYSVTNIGYSDRIKGNYEKKE